MEFCGGNCCANCPKAVSCGGCEACNGQPFGGLCVAAEIVKRGGREALAAATQAVVAEVNALGIPGLEISQLYLLSGSYVNLEYQLPGGQLVKFLNDKNVYWGNQIEREGSDRCYGLVADEDFILVCEYGCEGSCPEVIVYKKR